MNTRLNNQQKFVLNDHDNQIEAENDSYVLICYINSTNKTINKASDNSFVIDDKRYFTYLHEID
jgi:hypothetical protein